MGKASQRKTGAAAPALACGTSCGVALAVVAAIVSYVYTTHAPHVTHRGATNASHPYHVFNPIWSPDEVQNLLTRVVRSDRLKSTTAAYTPARYDHIGEKVPILPDGTCPSSFLTPNHDRTHCIFPERIDVARHQMLSGGIDALKDSYGTAVSRLIVLQRYFHGAEGGIEGIPEVEALFKSEAYMSKARLMCEGRDHLVPMTLAVIVSLPGQMVAMHYE